MKFNKFNTYVYAIVLACLLLIYALNANVFGSGIIKGEYELCGGCTWEAFTKCYGPTNEDYYYCYFWMDEWNMGHFICLPWIYPDCDIIYAGFCCWLDPDCDVFPGEKGEEGQREYHESK